MEYVLQTKDLCKDYGGRLAVDNVSINVPKGGIYGFIGENGAGKTTLMRMVSGLAGPTRGQITLFGSNDLRKQRHRMGVTIENPGLYPAMTALENMEVQRILLGIKDKTVSEKLLDMVGLAKTGGKKSKDFSLGMKQRLMIALALLDDPEFLVLDEPTNGLDPMGIKEVRDFFHHLNAEKGITILISSHILGELEKIATDYGVISHGKLIDEFRASAISSRCGQNLLIKTPDVIKTEQVIKALFPDAVTGRTADTVTLKGHIEDANAINAALMKNNINVSALYPQGETLEDYFMKLMGGKQQYV